MTARAQALQSRYALRRMPLLARNAVCTSQPFASQAGLEVLRSGGNAVDAALAAAAALTVVEPIMNGVGGDMYAIVWDGNALHGLNSTGNSPAAWHRERFDRYQAMPMKGWDSVTVPGQVAGWAALSRRFGKLSLARVLEPAAALAERGAPVSPFIAGVWPELAALVSDQPGFAETFLPGGRAPRAGETFSSPALAATLREIGATDGESLYRGRLAQALLDFSDRTGGCLSQDDLERHVPQWQTPIKRCYRDLTLHEMPPNGMGIAALMALGILEHFDVRSMGVDSAEACHVQIEAMRLAFADLHAHVADPAAMQVSVDELLSHEYLEGRARTIDLRQAHAPRAGMPKTGGTVYLTTSDASGMMVSFIQSNYWAFGSGLVVPGTGISLHNRGANFTLERGHPNEVGPHKAPLHTIIPGFVTRNGQPLVSFGVMGGAMQSQGHLQVMSRLADFEQDLQSVCDAPRFMLSPVDGKVSLEMHSPVSVVEGLVSRGHSPAVLPSGHLAFGSSQLIERYGDCYLAVSDGRRDGVAVGY